MKTQWLARGIVGLALLAAALIMVAAQHGAAQAEPDANRWSALGDGVNDYVNALAIHDDDVYAGGGFTQAGGKSAKRMAEWSTTSKEWSKCKNGVKGNVNALLAYEGKIFVGGSFGGGLKTWDPVKEKWKSVGGGVQGYVTALAFDRGDIYVGGKFDIVGGNVTAHNIAKYNVKTKKWSALGNGLDNQVWRIAPIASGLVFVGGEFRHEYGGANTLSYIAAWDGSGWSALGSGLNGPVYAIAPHENVLFVGGAFTQAGGVDANYLAVWHLVAPNTWEEWGGGVSDGTFMGSTFVWTIEMVGNDAYIGGSFGKAGGSTSASNIVMRNTDTHMWAPLGWGVDDAVWALAYNSEDHALYAGGEFTRVGESYSQEGSKHAKHIARWRLKK